MPGVNDPPDDGLDLLLLSLCKPFLKRESAVVGYGVWNGGVKVGNKVCGKEDGE